MTICSFCDGWIENTHNWKEEEQCDCDFSIPLGNYRENIIKSLGTEDEVLMSCIGIVIDSGILNHECKTVFEKNHIWLMYNGAQTLKEANKYAN